jgi:hypothetical protein
MDDRRVLPVLTVGRTLGAVAIALALAVAARLGVLALSVSQMEAQQAVEQLKESPNPWVGIETVFLGAIVGLLLSVVTAITVVAIVVRGRQRSAAFTAIFASVLVVVLVAQSIEGNGGVGAVALPRAGDPAAALFIVGLPLSWALPSAIVGALRWRWFALVVIAGAAAALVYALAA